MGLLGPRPRRRAYGEGDLAAARRAAAFLDAGFPEESSIEILRVVGVSMSRIAEAMRATTAQALARPGDTERDLGLRLADFASFASETWGAWLSYVLNSTCSSRSAATSSPGRRRRRARDPGRAGHAACAFADLVGFTRLGERRPVDELGAVAERLADMAASVAEPPVRLVKTIGDAAMLVSPEPGPLVDATLALVAAAEEEGDTFPQLRAGAPRPRPAPAGGLVRAHRQRGQPGHRGGARGQRAGTTEPVARRASRAPTAGRSPASAGSRTSRSP